MIRSMPARIPDSLHKKISQRLGFYDDLGVRLFYKDRGATISRSVAAQSTESFAEPSGQQISYEESALPKSTRKPEPPKPSQPAPRFAPPLASAPSQPARKPDPLPVPAGPSLFEAFDKVPDDSLLKIRADLGECTRCKLHKTRNKIVFGDGSPKAELVFVGEGPGHDEDLQGSPLRRPRRKTSHANDRSHGLAAQRRLHLQCRQMPPAGKSPPGKRRSHSVLAVPPAPARRHQSKSDRRSRRLLPHRRSLKPRAAFPNSAANGLNFAAEN